MTTTGAAPVESAMLPAPRVATGARRAPVPLVVVGTVVGALFVGPLVYLVVRTLGFGDAAIDVLRSDDALGPLLRTLLLAATVSSTCAVLGTALAWLAARTDLPGRGVLRVVLVLPLVIPSFVGAFALQAAVASEGLFDDLLGLGTGITIEGFWAAFLAITLLSYPYVYLPVLARLSALPPEIEESARALGRTPAAVFRSIVLPQASGAIAAGTLLDLPLLRQRVRRRVAHAIRHADGPDRGDAAPRPHDVDHAQPAARGGRDRRGGVGARARPPAGPARGACRRAARAGRAPRAVAGARPRARPRHRVPGARGAGRRARQLGHPRPVGRTLRRPRRHGGRSGHARAQHGRHQPRGGGRRGRGAAPGRVPHRPQPQRRVGLGEHRRRERLRVARSGDRARARVVGARHACGATGCTRRTRCSCSPTSCTSVRSRCARRRWP